MQKQEEAQLRSFAEKLFRQRYRLAIVCCKISSEKAETVQAVARQLQANYINVASELLTEIAREGYSPTLGAFSPNDMIEYIISNAGKANVNFVIIDQVEPLLATFGRTKVIQFFRMLIQLEPLKPVILVTYLKKQIDEAKFPVERTLNL